MYQTLHKFTWNDVKVVHLKEKKQDGSKNKKEAFHFLILPIIILPDIFDAAISWRVYYLPSIYEIHLIKKSSLKTAYCD
jgi:hypothetical protein